MALCGADDKDGYNEFWNAALTVSHCRKSNTLRQVLFEILFEIWILIPRMGLGHGKQSEIKWPAQAVCLDTLAPSRKNATEPGERSP